MSRILIATVPLSGHVNPGIPIARRLVERGHDVLWYCGSHFSGKISATGARFVPFSRATDFYDSNIEDVFGRIPTRSLLAHASFYVYNIFYRSMPAYYADLKDILQDFDADLIISDEWFTGGIPFGEKGEKKWVIWGNSPLMMLSDDAPAPGTGLRPGNSIFNRNRDRIVNNIIRMIFRPLDKKINALRAQVGLGPMDHFFMEQPLFNATLAIKFNTPIFEYPRKETPSHLHFVGPILPETTAMAEFSWMPQLQQGKPVIFITQGSVDNYNDNKLLIPALKALHKQDYVIVISTGGRETGDLQNHFSRPGIIIEPFIPYALIMPHVAVMITNGGYGGVSTALSFGVPLIVAGNSEDKPEIATRIMHCGAGINLKTGKPSPRSILKAVKRVLSHPEYRLNAARVRDDFNSHDAVKESVKLIEGLLDAHPEGEK